MRMRNTGLISPYEDLGFGNIRGASDEFGLAVGAFAGTKRMDGRRYGGSYWVSYWDCCGWDRLVCQKYRCAQSGITASILSL